MQLFNEMVDGIYLACALAMGATLIKPIITQLNTSSNDIVTHKELNAYKGDTGYLISSNVRLSNKYSKEHVIVFGPTGVGKTSHIMKHNVQNLTSGTVICTDPSGEIRKSIYRNDCEILCFNPLNPKESIGYDPLILCETEYEVRNIIETLLTNGFSSNGKVSGDMDKWVKLASPFLKLYAVYNFRYRKYTFSEMILRVLNAPIKMKTFTMKEVKPQEPQKKIVFENGKIKSIPDTQSKLERVPVIDTNSIEYEITETHAEDLIDEFYAFLRTMESPETLSSIQLTLNSGLALFKDKNVQVVCNKKPFSFKKLREKNCILFIQIPENMSHYFAPLIAIFVQQLMDNGMRDSKGKDIFFVLDELCNIGYIPHLDRYLSTVRRYNIGIMGCTQSINQLKSLYGEEDTRVILENFNTRCAMSGLTETSDYFSNLLGTQLIEEPENHNYKQEVISKDEVRRLDENKILIVCKNKRGVIDTLLPFFKIVEL